MEFYEMLSEKNKPMLVIFYYKFRFHNVCSDEIGIGTYIWEKIRLPEFEPQSGISGGISDGNYLSTTRPFKNCRKKIFTDNKKYVI